MKKRNVAYALTASAALVVCAQAGAGEPDSRWYVAPSVSFIGADDDRQAKNHLGGQLGVGRSVSDSWNLEFSGVGDNLHTDNGANTFRQRGLLLDGLYFLNRSPGFAPYAVIGAGALRTTYAGSRNTNPMANAGLGVMHTFNDYGLALRADARYRIDRDDNSIPGEKRFGDWLVNVGLVIPLGAKAVAPVAMAAPVVAAVVAPPAPPMDSDNDGVVDKKDRCPNTPAGAKVNAEGCELDNDADGVVDSKDRCPNSPAGAKVNAEGCELDGDADGVVDSKDRCPNSPAGAKVNAEGCELDSDADGVVDSKDRCPDSKVGVKVDGNGCEIAEVIVLKGVNFETSTDRLTKGSIDILNGVADTLSKRPEITVEVAGYTDSRGSASVNQKLSQKRAQMVANYLISRGVKAEKLSAKGYGAANPVADNATAAGQAQNRRVELHILQ